MTMKKPATIIDLERAVLNLELVAGVRLLAEYIAREERGRRCQRRRRPMGIVKDIRDFRWE